jgi:hypothetical protein
MGGCFWQEAVSSPNSLVGLEANVVAVVTALLSSSDAQDGSQRPGGGEESRPDLKNSPTAELSQNSAKLSGKRPPTCS